MKQKQVWVCKTGPLKTPLTFRMVKWHFSDILMSLVFSTISAGIMWKKSLDTKRSCPVRFGSLINYIINTYEICKMQLFHAHGYLQLYFIVKFISPACTKEFEVTYSILKELSVTRVKCLNTLNLFIQFLALD